MPVICLISFVCVAALWFLSNEYPTLFGIYLPTCVLRRVTFKIIVAVTLVAAVLLSGISDVEDNVRTLFGLAGIDCLSLLIVLLSSLIVLTVLKMFSVRGSAVYALLGGLEAYCISIGNDGDVLWALAFLIAPLTAFVLSCFISRMLRLAFGKSHIHLLTLSFYMRHAVIAGIVLTAFAVGINWGGFLMAGASVVQGGPATAIVVGVLVLSISVMSPFMRNVSDENAGEYSDFSIYTVLSTGFSTALVLLFFSFDASAGLLGMKAVPLSVGSLVYASVAGAETARRARIIEPENHVRETAALVFAPLGTLLISYLILYVTGNNEENLVDFTVMAAAIIVLAALVFWGYVRRQQRQREMTDRLVYSQQQQIYENSRALNDMQLKVVLSENQALHDAVEMKRQEVMNVALSIVEQKEYLESLNDIVKRLAKSDDEKERIRLIGELGTSLKQRLSYDRDVDTAYFYAQAESLHEDFNAKLAENFPELTQQERRLATLLRLGFSSKYIATLMNITPKSVEISRYRLRQKLGLSKGDNLVNFIKSI